MRLRGSEAFSSLRLCFRRGMGHDLLPALLAQHGRIDLLFGPNAGESKCSNPSQLLSSADQSTVVTRLLPCRRTGMER